MIARLARAVRRQDDGITLTELMVGMMLTAIALAMIGGFFANITRSVSTARAARTGTATASNVADELSRVIRTAAATPVSVGSPTPAIVDGTGTTLTVTSYVDTDAMALAPTKVSFAVNSSGDLMETRTAGQQSGGYWTFSGATTTRTIPGPISTSAQLFTYMDSTGATVTPAATGLTAAQEATITAVTITVNAANSTSDPVQIVTTAVMNNLTLS